MSEEKSYSKLGGVYSKKEIQAKDKEYHEELQKLRSQGANKNCADCGKADSNWASCNLGIFICVNCAQVHRGLGTHITKVKSCMGTYAWHPDEMDRMRSTGNAKSNEHYLALNPNPTIQDIKNHITDKYVNQLYVKK